MRSTFCFYEMELLLEPLVCLLLEVARWAIRNRRFL